MHMLRGHTETSEEELEMHPTPSLAESSILFGALMDFLLFGEHCASTVTIFQIQPWFCTLCTVTHTALKG